MMTSLRPLHAHRAACIHRRLQAALRSYQPTGPTPQQYASVYSRRSQQRLRPAPPPSHTARAPALPAAGGSLDAAPQTERPVTMGRRQWGSRKPSDEAIQGTPKLVTLVMAGDPPKSPSPPCDKGPSPPLTGRRFDQVSDPVATWLTEKRRKQVMQSKRKEHKKQKDLMFTQRMQDRQKLRNETSRAEGRCNSLMAECESTLKALENAWKQEAERAQRAHFTPHGRHNTSASAWSGGAQECALAGEIICAPLRGQLRAIVTDAQRCNLGPDQRQAAVEQRLVKLQDLQTALDNAMVSEERIAGAQQSTSMSGLAGLASLAARAVARQSPAPLTMADMADDVEFFSRHYDANADKNDGKPVQIHRGAMRDVMAAYQHVRENVAWRASIDPTGRHSESLRALTDGSDGKKNKQPSSARARAAARRGQPLSSARQIVLA